MKYILGEFSGADLDRWKMQRFGFLSIFWSAFTLFVATKACQPKIVSVAILVVSLLIEQYKK